MKKWTRYLIIFLQHTKCDGSQNLLHGWKTYIRSKSKPKGRVELPTSSLLMTCSNQLSYLGVLMTYRRINNYIHSFWTHFMCNLLIFTYLLLVPVRSRGLHCTFLQIVALTVLPGRFVWYQYLYHHFHTVYASTVTLATASFTRLFMIPFSFFIDL